MAISKQFLKTKPECKVKFTISAKESGSANSVSLVGSFNGWSKTATPMKKQKDGSFSVTVTLPAGGSNKFRYLVNGEHWLNDAKADGYEYCSFAAGENSLLKL